MSTRTPWFAFAIAFLLTASTAAAQREGYSYLSYVGSEVSLVSSAEDDSSARLNTPILAGDRIVTGSTSRAEAILADGNILRIDVQTNLRFDRLARTYEAEDDQNVLSLERGAVSLEQRSSTTRDQATRIDTDDVTIVFPGKVLLRVETGRRGTEIYVTSGQVEVNARSGRATLSAGQYAFASGDAKLEIDWLDEPRDQFTRFVADRRNLTGAGSGTQYVSAEYDYDYAASGFDRYGSWIQVDGSWAWRPSVAADWRPYTDGYWRWSPSGLTWVSYESWGWLPYHYGSWDWDARFGWYWSPDTVYSPAWVYWDYTPSWVGWCPIGYYGGYYGGHHGGQHGNGYPRSQRHAQGAERGTHAYPHLRGPVDVTRIDPRGWSYSSTAKIGSRFDTRRDVLGHESVGFRPGERGFVVTTPLRIDRGRGGSVTTAVQEAVRRVPQTMGAEARGGRGLADLTPVLRRGGTLDTATQESLRRAFVTPGQDPGYRPVSADQTRLAPARRSGRDDRGEPGEPFARSTPWPRRRFDSRPRWRGGRVGSRNRLHAARSLAQRRSCRRDPAGPHDGRGAPPGRRGAAGRRVRPRPECPQR